MAVTQHTCVVRVHLFLFLEDTGQYREYGSVGCAIIGTLSDLPLYKMGCYNEKNEYLCTASITTNNETGACVALQQGGYVSFKDEQGKNWSMQFETEDHAIEFCAHVSVAMYGASGQPDQSIIACDFRTGKRERAIFANDAIKVRYQGWVIQCDTQRKKLPFLGSKLDGNLHDDKPYTMDVPANHMSVLPDMKGFEGMVIAMGEEGSRFVVIPVKAKRGGGPQVHMCYYVHIVRKKDLTRAVANHKTAVVALSNSTPQTVEQAKVVPFAAEYDAIHRLKSPFPGFSREQLLVIDRTRDQIQVLSQQLQEARRQLDTFMNDINAFERGVKPQSLASAQIEYSIKKLLTDTEESRELLTQKDITLRQMEEKNRELHKKVDKFSATANLLAEEKKISIISSKEEKLDMDRRIAQAQAQLARLQSEREDVARHLSTVKRLLQVADQDIKIEKQKLQVASVSFQTNESKLAASEESHAEEMARRKILESKVSTLGDQLRCVLEEVRVKESQIEERRQKIGTDKLHYTQLIEDERSKAASDIRELRQELIDELAIRDRRYQEERQKVAHESLERGRLQGIEDGQAEALLEADAATHELTLTVQRRNAEVNAVRIRLRGAIEQNEADERRLVSQIKALEESLCNIVVENSQMETELNSLKSARKAVEDDAFQEIMSAIEQLSRPVGQKDLLAVIHSLRVKREVNYGFEEQRAKEQQNILAAEREEVRRWVTGTLDGEFVPFPPMRTLHTPEAPMPYLPEVTLWGETEISAEMVESRLSDEVKAQEEAIQFDPDEMNRRYNELLLEFMNVKPDLGLVSNKDFSGEQGDINPRNGLPLAREDLVSDSKKPPSLTIPESVSPQPQPQHFQEGLLAQHRQQGFAPQQKREVPYPFQRTAPQEAEESRFGSLECPDSVSGKGGKESQFIAQFVEPEKIKVGTQGDRGVASSGGPKPEGNAKNSKSQIAPPPNRGVPPRTKKVTFSDSDSDSNPPLAVAAKVRLVQRTLTAAPAKKSLFDDSDSSDGPLR